MIARLVTYRTDALEAAEAWARERAGDLRTQEQVRHAYFLTAEDPPRAGALILYDSRAALRAYKDSDAYQEAVREIAEGWGVSAEPYSEEVYELLDV